MIENTVEAAALSERVAAFYDGVRATSLALMAVLKSKVAVGLLTDELAQRVLEDTGAYIINAIEELPE